MRLESLADEKAELERHLITFNRRHDDALGEVIQRLLKAKAELARLMTADLGRETDGDNREEAEAEAYAAEDAYKDYAREHSKLKHADPLPMLDEESERELKLLYRKACSLCHPDKFPDDRKEAAHRAFVELQEAYKSNNLSKLRDIYRVLVAGDMSGFRSNTLSGYEGLMAAVAELEFSIIKHVTELKALIESEGFKLLRFAGESEGAWQRYFEQQKERLEEEVASVLSRIIEVQRNE